MKKINPNDFITIEGTKLDQLNNVWTQMEITTSIKNIKNIEKWVRGNNESETTYQARVEIQYQAKSQIHNIKINKKKYESLKSLVKRVDFSIPVIETTESIREIVKEQIKEMKQPIKVTSAIDCLEAGDLS